MSSIQKTGKQKGKTKSQKQEREQRGRKPMGGGPMGKGEFFSFLSKGTNVDIPFCQVKENFLGDLESKFCCFEFLLNSILF